MLKSLWVHAIIQNYFFHDGPHSLKRVSKLWTLLSAKLFSFGPLKGAFAIGVRDFSVESPNTMLVN